MADELTPEAAAGSATATLEFTAATARVIARALELGAGEHQQFDNDEQDLLRDLVTHFLQTAEVLEG
jgi:hypothetical protein